MAVANNNSLEYCVKNLTQCPICLADISNPTSLPCLHTFCLNCLQTMCENLIGSDNLQCPVCRKCCPIPQSGADGFQHNFFIQSLLDAKSCSDAASQPRCDVCANIDDHGAASANVPNATVFCVNCSQKLCDRCSIPHKRMPGGSHQIKQLDDGFEWDLVRLRANNCRQHQDEMVKLYCFQCEVDMCWMCAAVQHRNHECQEISHVAEKLKGQLIDLAGKVSTKAEEVQKLLKLLDVEKVTFISSTDAAEKLIKKTGEDMKQLIDSQVSELLNELAASKVEEVKKFEEERSSFELALVALESFNTYACELKEKGSSGDIVRASKELETRANELMMAQVTNYQGTSLTFVPLVTKANKLLIGELRRRSPSPQLSSPEPTDRSTEIDLGTFSFKWDDGSPDFQEIVETFSPPSAPVNARRGNSIISWEQPLEDGGSPITGYVIEHTLNDGQWSEYRRTSHTTRRMKVPQHQLWFGFLRYRVRAVNAAGLGSPSHVI